MIRIRLILMLATVGACAPQANGSVDSSVQQAATPAGQAAVQAAIDSAIATFRDAAIEGDAERMASVFADDAMVLRPNMPAASGRAAIVAMNQGMVEQMTLAAATFTTLDLIVTGDYAIETGTYEMTLKPKEGGSISDVGKYVSIWERQDDGRWLMIRDISNSDQPEA